MSCPDWNALAAWRETPQAEEPAEWREALGHLDRGCAHCRRAALAADPTLVFRRLVAPCALRDRSAVPEPTPAQEASDIESMRRAVAAMRAASRVEEVERHGRAARAISWKRWSAAAALAVVALSMPGDETRLRRDAAVSLMSVATPAVLSAEGPEAVVLPASVFPVASTDELPTVEGVNRPGARVYHMDGEGMSVVMIVDETLDV
ncbi:MAG TPA: hypothetical protein VKM72_21175 [Thermoanaerobaculia bacterium]|nr:hypothetical protein [Thermoanaerobaculia bacterium]